MLPDQFEAGDLARPPGQGDCRRISRVLSRVGDKWSVLIVMLLCDGPRRFNEIKRLMGGISQRMLTLTLRGLERDGMVSRTMFPTVPPRVDYALTPLGRSLSEPVLALGSWARVHLDEIDAARDSFDARDGRAAPLSLGRPTAVHPLSSEASPRE